MPMHILVRKYCINHCKSLYRGLSKTSGPDSKCLWRIRGRPGVLGGLAEKNWLKKKKKKNDASRINFRNQIARYINFQLRMSLFSIFEPSIKYYFDATWHQNFGYRM